MNFNIIKGLFSDKKFIYSKSNSMKSLGSFYDFKVNTLNGKAFDLSAYKGKKVVVINTASKCGFTPQYADWQKFHEAYGDKVVVIGFPANDFLKQEPGTNTEIAEFCQKNYGVTFQMFEKVVVTGKEQHPLYAWLSKKDLNGWNEKSPTWNFCKYVIDENGNLTNFFGPDIKPENQQFKKAVGI
jgi:glutathione peroxidase